MHSLTVSLKSFLHPTANPPISFQKPKPLSPRLNVKYSTITTNSYCRSIPLFRLPSQRPFPILFVQYQHVLLILYPPSTIPLSTSDKSVALHVPKAPVVRLNPLSMCCWCPVRICCFVICIHARSSSGSLGTHD